jgi:flavorubredoxin
VHEPYRSGDDVYVLPTAIDVPTVGTIPVNSFVLLAEQPVLVDTGLTIDSAEFIEALRSVIDPAELRWIWLTHDDTDHTGALPAVMEQAPDARLATHGLGVLRMRTWWPVPLERVHALAHGDLLDVGDRLLRALRPPTYDNPMSMALFDESTATLFSVDSFGAIVPRLSEEIDDFSEEELVGGMTAWATFDSPWSHLSDRSRFAAMLDEIRQLDAQRILSSHLPPVVGRAEQLLDVVASIPDAEPFVAPNAAAFDQIAAGFARQGETDASHRLQYINPI